MTAKETKIKETYESAGVDWEQVKEYVDANDGYCYVFYEEEGKRGIDWHTETPLTYSGIDAYDENDVEYWRPKSLSGIENNNGWITIESEKDLPSDVSAMYRIGHFRKNGEFYQDENIYPLNKAVEALNDLYTHYQPILKPKPPIY